MIKKRIYVSGRISGTRDYACRFAAAETRLLLRGHDAINPVKRTKKGKYADMIRADLRLIDECDAVYMLKDWMQSQGARLEHDYAAATGKEIIYEEDEKQ